MMTADTSSSLFSNSSVNNCSSTGTLFTSSCLTPWYIVAGVITAASCLLGIPANIVVIAKLVGHLRGSSISKRLFFNLALSDLLCLLCMPVGVLILHKGPHLSNVVCQLFFYFFFLCIISDLNILVMISIQRYYQVLHPKKWAKLDRTWQRLLLFSTWLLGALVALPVVFFQIEANNEDEWTDGHAYKSHRVTPALQAVYVSYIVFSHLVLLFCYLLLVRGVKRTQMANKKQPRATKLFIRIIAASLVVGFLPLILHVMYVAALLTSSDKLLYVSKMLTFVECFYFFSYCLNPFLYYFATRHRVNEGNNNRSLFNDNS